MGPTDLHLGPLARTGRDVHEPATPCLRWPGSTLAADCQDLAVL